MSPLKHYLWLLPTVLYRSNSELCPTLCALSMQHLFPIKILAKGTDRGRIISNKIEAQYNIKQYLNEIS
jgi:hypothetical protein